MTTKKTGAAKGKETQRIKATTRRHKIIQENLKSLDPNEQIETLRNSLRTALRRIAKLEERVIKLEEGKTK